MFFTRHLPKMLFVMGLATASSFIYAIAPEWAILNILRLPYDETFAENDFGQGHYFLYYHWGVMVGFMGVVIVVAAFKKAWRAPVVFYSFAEKAWMVALYPTFRRLTKRIFGVARVSSERGLGTGLGDRKPRSLRLGGRVSG